MMNNRIARGIDWFADLVSPKWGLKRRMYRNALDTVQNFSTYKGASQNRLRSSWIGGSGSPDEDLLPELRTLRERSRDLNRNDAHASGITGTMTTNVVGTGIRPQSRIDKETLDISEVQARTFQKDAERVWKTWAPYADAGNRMDFYEIQQLIDRQILENGEALIVPIMSEDKNRPYALALQVIEADRLDTPAEKRGDASIRSGVRIGEHGEPVSYFIQKTHPGDVRYGNRSEREFVEIPAMNKYGRKNVFHLYYVQRPGQTRGVPFFAPVLNYFKDLAEYAEAELVAARIAACFSLFITSEASMDIGMQGLSRDAREKMLESLEPGMIRHLLPGESVTSFSPQRPGSSFEPFVERILKAIAASLGLPYELVAKDFSKTNYSSARAALLEARRYFKVRQEWLAKKLCQPVWEMVLEEAYLRGELNAPTFYEKRTQWMQAFWIAPGWQFVDPTKEVQAAVDSLNNGITTLADEVSSQGKDWEEVIEQKAREALKIKELEMQYGIQIIKNKELEPYGNGQDNADKTKDRTDPRGYRDAGNDPDDNAAGSGSSDQPSEGEGSS